MDEMTRMVERYGTLRAAARVLGVPEQRLYKWHLRQRIPSKYLPLIARKLRQ